MTAAPPIEARTGYVLLVSGTEVWCRDKDVLERIAGALTPAMPLLPVAEMDRVWFPGLDLAHLVDQAPPVAAIFCDPDVIARDLPGTGSQDEIDWAAKLDLCRACVRKAALRTVR